MRWRIMMLMPGLVLVLTAWLRADYASLVRETPGLLAWYRFEPGDSDRVTDSAGRGQDGQQTGSVAAGTPSAFDSLGQAITLKDGGHLRVPALGEHDAVSVELWIKLAKPAAEGIAGLYAGDQWQAGFLHFNLKSNGALELAVNGVSAFAHSAPDTVVIGRWTHLVMTYDRDAGQLRLFKDGRLVEEQDVTVAPRMKLVEASIGTWRQDAPGRPLEADLDEFAVYSVALTPAQVRQHYFSAKGIEPRAVSFEKEVRPLFAKHCLRCHGPEAQESELRLDVRDIVLRGGESGEPAIAPYDAEASHLLKLVLSKSDEERMPPEGDPLTTAEVATLRDWIENGAPWPDELAGHVEIRKVETSHWSFQPIRDVSPPVLEHDFTRSGSAIDAFVLQKLMAAGIEPSPPADRRTLLRRLHLVLHGLPPTPEEVLAFEHDQRPDAWTRLVDAALASPRYGERWASHWLDVIRYGDTHGFEVNTPRDNAWPYRDYVIRSLNEDKPYDRFIQEQLAGDQLGVDSATGFLVAAPALLPGQVGKDLASMRQARQDELHEVIVTVGSGVLGLTVGCARCHNHKFDPVSQRDYYQLQALLTGVRYGDRPVRKVEEVRLNPAGPMPDIKTVFAGQFTQATATHRLYRGDPMQRREQVAPDVPAVFGSLRMESTTPDPQRRMALAQWLTDRKNPLPARVIVNRLWQHHFGTGLVATPSDFGAMGAKPSHPELLDWLAATLIAEGNPQSGPYGGAWSLKKIHRLILTSSTWQQASFPNDAGLAKDAGSRLLWRYPPRRLDMEPIRDSILAVSGTLNLTMGGPGFSIFKPNSNYVRVYEPREDFGPEEWRRMIYVHRVRMEQDGVFGAFDCPDAGQPAPRRGRSTTALQALNLLNSAFMTQQAGLLAARIEREAGAEHDAQLDRAFALVLCRRPERFEIEAARQVKTEFGLAAVCRALLNSSEFLTIP